MKRRVVVSALVSMLVFAAVGIGYYLFLEPGKGTSTPQTVGGITNDGKELALLLQEGVSIASPGANSGNLKLWVKNESTHVQQIRKLVFTATNTKEAEGCQNSWFKATGTGKIGEALTAGGAAVPIPIPVSGTPTEILNGGVSPNGTLQTEFIEEGAVNQNACAGTSVTWHMTSTG